MCNLYSLTMARQAVLRLFRVSDNRAEQMRMLPAIFPGHEAPVVRRSGEGARELVQLSWGFVLPQAGRAPRRVTNTRDDKARSSPFWRDSFEHRRCLVPASSFAEPADVTPATWHWFALKGEEPRPPFAFAGLWRRHKGPIRKDGPSVELDVFSFMTTTPNSLVATINHERMPVILADERAFDTWLEGTPEEAFSLVAPFDAQQMRIVREGRAKEDDPSAPEAQARSGRLL
ncbi:MAG: SOS response-associated peptidase family protein [Hyphomicrobiaceae bacterium]